MVQEMSNMATLLTIYFLILIKYIFISDNYFDIHFIMSTLFIIIINWIKLAKNKGKTVDKIKDIGKFLTHVMFISFCFSIICNVISFIYGILFYFGFSNTIIFFKILCVFFMSDLIPMFKKQLNEKLSKSNIGTKILEGINHYYNTYVISKNIYEHVIEYGKYILKNYIWVYCKTIFNKFLEINNELAENSQSTIVKSKINDKYNDAKKYITNQVIQPMVMESFQSVLESEPFANIDLTNIDLTNFDMEIQNNSEEILPASKQYKKFPHVKNMNMSSLANKKTINDDNFDDLDEDLDLSNVPEVSEEQIKKAEMLDKKIMANQDDIPKNKTSDDNRTALRKKMAEKKAIRTIGNRQAIKNNISNIMNMPEMNDFMKKMPGMNEMMNSMINGNNFDKLLNQIPKNKDSQPSFDNNQLKELLKGISKKN